MLRTNSVDKYVTKLFKLAAKPVTIGISTDWLNINRQHLNANKII